MDYPYDPAGRMPAVWLDEEGEESATALTEDYTLWTLAADVMAHFDTTYGYQGPNGEGCSHLHARIISQLYVEFAGAELEWRNEFEGQWYSSLADLVILIGAGAAADRWFREEVAPVLAAIGCK